MYDDLYAANITICGSFVLQKSFSNHKNSFCDSSRICCCCQCWRFIWWLPIISFVTINCLELVREPLALKEFIINKQQCTTNVHRMFQFPDDLKLEFCISKQDTHTHTHIYVL